MTSPLARAEVIESMTAGDWVKWTDQFRTKSTALENCDPTRGTKGPRQIALKMSNYKCSEVFAPVPPASLPAVILPDEWADPKNRTHYWPVCSLTMAAYTKARDDDTVTGSLQEAADYSKKTDACAPKPATLSLSGPPPESETDDRYSKKYVAPSAAKLKLPPPMNGTEKQDWETYIRLTQAAVADQCCAQGDTECVKAMEQVRLVWCDPPSDPKAPNDCLRGAGFHMKEEERKSIIDWATAPPPPAGKKKKKQEPVKDLTPPVVSGEVIFSPYAKVMSQKKISIAHEFAHACSLIQRQLMAKRKEVPYEDSVIAMMDKNTHCKIDPAREQVYKKLFAAAGWEAATSDCFLATAQAAGKGNGYTADCDNSCPGQMMEEGYAQSQGLRLVPNQKWVPYVLPGGCADSRDSRHISGAQILRCMALTPAFQERIKAVTGCKP